MANGVRDGMTELKGRLSLAAAPTTALTAWITVSSAARTSSGEGIGDGLE